MTYSATIEAEPSLVGYWKLDETSGTVAADSSTNSNNGTIAGTPTLGANGLVFEPSGKCIDFDGVDDVVTITPATIAGSAVSFECWIKTSAAASTSIYLADGNPNRFTFAWNTTTSGQLGLYDGTTWFDFGAAPNDGIEHHVVFVCNGTTAKAYVDGVQFGTNKTIVAIDWSAITALALGRDYTTASNYFTGKNQNNAIYNTALTPLQIRKHYQAGIAQGFHKEVLALNPTGYWPLNEVAGDAIDWSGNDNNGTITGDITQAATGLLGYDGSTAYTMAGTNAEIAITHPASTTTYSLVALVSIASATGEYKILEDNGIGHWSIKDGKQNLNYSAADHLSTTAIAAATTHLVGLSCAAGAVTFYLDGASDGSASSAIALNFETISDALTAFDGTLQVVGIADTAWTEAQHRTLAQSARTLIESRGYPKVIQNLTPSGYWRLAEASGTTAFDESGNGNDGVINGSPVMATADGALHQSRLKAMTFDGTNDFVQTTYAGQTGSTARTLLAWVKPSSLAAVNPVAAYGTNTAADMFQFTVETDGKIKLDINASDVKGSTVLAINNYYLITAVLTGTDVNSIDLYVNGAVETEAYTSGATVLTTASSVNMRIGQDIGATLFFTGDMGEVMEVNSALTAQQIKQIYEAGKSRYAAEVISYQPELYYRQNEASGTVAFDYGSGANDGTISGTPTMGVADDPLTNEVSTSISYDGTNDEISAGDVLNKLNTDSFTMMAWLKTATTSTDIFYSKFASNRGFEISVDSTGVLDIKLMGTYPTNYIGVKSTNPVNDAVWHLVAIAYDGTSTAAGVSVLIDAITEAKTTEDDTLSETLANASPLTIGQRTGNVATLLGALAETAQFPVSLTAEQVLDIYEMASYTASASFFGITGTITESLAATDFYIRALQLDTGAFIADVAVAVDNTYSFDFAQIAGYETYTDEVLLIALPKTGKRRLNSTAYAVGDYYIPADVTTNDHIYKVTVAGTSAVSEPTLDQAGGTTVDGGVTVQDMGPTPSPQTLIGYPLTVAA